MLRAVYLYTIIQACFLRACRAWRAPGPWLGCGAACLRLEQWQEAEDALQHASRLDCNSSLVWGHLALLLLSMGEDRCLRGDESFFCSCMLVGCTTRRNANKAST